MLGKSEDRKSAVQMGVTLSSQIIQAALTILTIEVVYIAYVLPNRDTSIWFVLSAIAAFICFIVSIFIAGKAITRCRDYGFEGKWNISSSKNSFNYQALFCLVGLFFLGLTVVLSGNSKEIDLNRKFNNLENNYIKITSQLEILTTEKKNINNSLEKIKIDMENSKKSVEQLKIDVNNILEQINIKSRDSNFK